MAPHLATPLTIALSAAGGLAATLLHIPAGWLSGGAVAVAVAAALGAPVRVPSWLRDIAFVFTGLSMGASVARDSLALIGQWPVTLAALVVELILIVTLTGYMLRKLFGVDRGTAYLSSFPGHLSFVMGIAAAGVGNPRQITVIQVIRILMLTVAVPIGALFLPIGSMPAAVAVPEMTPLTLIGGIVACAALGFVFVRLRVPAGYVLGAMAAAVTAKLTGLLDGSLPPWLLIGTFIMIGALIGSRFAGITAREFRDAAVGGLIATAMTIGIVTAVAAAVLPFIDMPFGQVWLGLAPGGLESMGALGIAFGFDTAFIAAHHVSRLLLLTVAIPAVVVLIRGRG